MPKSASAIKTFKECTSLTRLLDALKLCVIDITNKIKEHLEDKQVYPLSATFCSRLFVWSRNRDELKINCFKKTVKMPAFDDFCRDPQCLQLLASSVFTENEKDVHLPVKMVSIQCMNFKPALAGKLPTRKIDNIFGAVQGSDREAYLKKKEEEQRRLNEEVKESKLRRQLVQSPPSKAGRNSAKKGKADPKGMQKLTLFFNNKK